MQKNDAIAAMVRSSVSISEPKNIKATPIAARSADAVIFLVLFDMPLLNSLSPFILNRDFGETYKSLPEIH